MSEYTVNEIDLRPYIAAVLSNWYWILGLGLLAGAITFGVTSLLVSPTYEATALVTVNEQEERVQIDPRIETVKENPPPAFHLEVAMSDELLASLRDETRLADSLTLQQYRSMLNASRDNASGVLKLAVKNADPEAASLIANTWAELLVSSAKKNADDSSAEQLLFFEQRLEDAAAELEIAERAFVEFQTQNQSIILQNELLVLQETHAALLAKQQQIGDLFRDIDSLLATFQDVGTDEDFAAGDRFTALILRLRIFAGSDPSSSADSPWRLQVNSEDLATEVGADLEEQLLELKVALKSQADQTGVALSEIEPQILLVQGEKQEALATESLLLRNLELAQDAHLALAHSAQLKRITSLDPNRDISLLSRSSVPTSPITPRKLLMTFAAFTGVAFLTVFILLVSVWWQLSGSTKPTSDTQNESV